jgi:hypothetical protein
VVILVVLVLGFLRLGSPWSQREINADLRRATDLSGITIDIHRRASGLPARLEEVGRASGASLKDPVTGVPYEYHPKGGRAYELCATFAKEGVPESEWDYRDGTPRETFWKHPAGRYCYQLDASQEPPF